MSYYFHLQFKMLNRHLREFGLPPVLGYLLSLIAFTGLSIYLFYKLAYAEYLYAIVAIVFLVQLSSTQRSDFLSSCFSRIDYLKIRLLENLIIALPFLLFLLYQSSWLFALLISVAAGLLVFLNQYQSFNYTLPTPFYRYPFEFTVGFRTTFALLFVTYFLTYMAIAVGNFNLGVFALLLICLTCFSYYSNPEQEYYVWIFSFTPAAFLFHKIKVALLFSGMLFLPVLLSLILFFPDHLYLLLVLQLLAWLYISLIILAKYSAFPYQINLPQGLLIAISVSFPPLLLGVIPYFYSQSIKRLSDLLQ